MNQEKEQKMSRRQNHLTLDSFVFLHHSSHHQQYKNVYSINKYVQKHSKSTNRTFIKWHYWILLIFREYLMPFKQHLDYHHNVNNHHLPNQVDSFSKFYFIFSFFFLFLCRSNILLFCKKTKWLWMCFIPTKTNINKQWLCTYMHFYFSI